MIASSQKHWSGDVADLLRVREGFVLADVDTRSTPGYEKDKAHAADDLQSGAAELDEYQERLYARSRVDETIPTPPPGAAGASPGASGRVGPASVLLVLQAMDSAGKGGIIRHVVGSVDPQGIVLAAFKKPTDEELKHDFLWRIKQRLPDSGMIGVFDRSHYEDVLIGRVRRLAPEQEIERRYAAINDFERQLTDSGTRVVKVMLHISPDEQKKRLMRRLNRLDKHWKYNPTDVDERELWPQYMAAYQTVFERTSTEHAPWFVVPADHKWYGRLAVQNLLLEALEDIDPQWPKATFDVEAEKLRLAAT
ncbi:MULTISPECIES: PPK2 family polyphosphate kinase [Microbacterium]|uniref:PPK2 family polyphosphate kinase n=1 Tax=Microbacterium TaxID=33882 RepID=UPI00285CA8F7|nr:PPK2 family polyphosphate kinase [Microbacterium trichothecenolyticum]MDR7183291.1 PPK2 family polyphosphate:nucleotide phosphotransferase [Microbacterium trichothecenolyticum]